MSGMDPRFHKLSVSELELACVTSGTQTISPFVVAAANPTLLFANNGGNKAIVVVGAIAVTAPAAPVEILICRTDKSRTGVYYNLAVGPATLVVLPKTRVYFCVPAGAIGNFQVVVSSIFYGDEVIEA